GTTAGQSPPLSCLHVTGGIDPGLDRLGRGAKSRRAAPAAQPGDGCVLERRADPGRSGATDHGIGPRGVRPLAFVQPRPELLDAAFGDGGDGAGGAAARNLTTKDTKNTKNDP